MFIIYAINVHQGGGATLLQALLKELQGSHESARVFIDQRMPVADFSSSKISFYRVNPTLGDRLRAEGQLRREVTSGDKVLCLGNLPPLFKLAGIVYLFLHNRYLVEPTKLNGFGARSRLRILVERLWLRHRRGHVDVFVVQTPTMYNLLRKKYESASTVRVWPFSGDAARYPRSVPLTDVESGGKVYDFLYVASGEPHKNHHNLIKAWCLLAGQGLSPRLCLTLNEDHALELLSWIRSEIARHKLNIEAIDLKSRADVQEALAATRAVIYPSKFESLGLPLLEARQAGLPVLAGELDYVRDVLDPEETFDPDSPVSISRAVKRFLGIGEKPLEVISAKEFIEKVTND